MNMTYKTVRGLKRSIRFVITALILTLLCSCGAPEDSKDNHIDLSDTQSSGSVVSAEQLIAAFERGGEQTITLDASIDMDDEILKLEGNQENATLTIIGNGNMISGNGDCVIRLAAGCKLVLDDVNITAGLNAIGCLGDATITGNADINAVAHAVYSIGHVMIGEGSRLYLKSNVGNGIMANGLELGNDARVLTDGGLGGVNVVKDDIVLNENAVLDSNTLDNYNALKCEGTLVMMDGSRLKVMNNGEYHGAEINSIVVDGVVTLEAQGGSKGVGLFMFALEDEIYMLGYCEPGLRNEVGDGSITFVADESEFPEETDDDTPDDTPEQTE